MKTEVKSSNSPETCHHGIHEKKNAAPRVVTAAVTRRSVQEGELAPDPRRGGPVRVVPREQAGDLLLEAGVG